MTCPSCGFKNTDGAPSCISCGAHLTQEASVSAEPDLPYVPPLDTGPPLAADASTVVSSEAESGPDVSRLYWVGTYAAMRLALKTSGIGSIAWGIVGTLVGLGLLVAGSTVGGVLMAGFGFCLLCEGLWLTLAPAPSGVIVDGIALCLLGIVNAGLAVLTRLDEGGGLPFYAYLGVFQIVMGVRSFRRYKHFAPLGGFKPDDATLKWVEETVKFVRKMRPAAHPEMISFTLAAEAWRVWLTKGMAIGWCQASGDIIIAGPEHLQLTPLTDDPGPRNVKAQVAFYNRQGKGQIERELLQRYRAWKAQHVGQ